MKKLTAATRFAAVVALALGLGTAAQAQQQPQLSLFSGNQLLYNPSIAGVEDYLSAKAGFRQQYSGITDGPGTFHVNVHGALNQRELNKEDLGALPMRGASSIRFKTETIRKIRHGLGGFYVNDRSGQLARNAFGAAYAIHVPFAKTWYFSGGASLGFSSMQLNTSWKNLHDGTTGDPMLAGRTLGLFDATLGAMVYNDRFYAAISAAQLAQNKLQFGDQTLKADATKLNVHYYLTAGYRLTLSDELELSPVALVKYTRQTVAADLQARVRFRQSFFAGVGYRIADANVDLTGDGVTGLVGLSFNKLVDVSYSYDFTTSGLQVGSNGSHELTLGVRLFNTKKANPRIW